MEIELYAAPWREQFADMFIDYFIGDLSAPFPEAQIREEILPKFIALAESGVAPVLLAVHDGKAIGFINFQIDSEASNWNERPGWGFIRELHVNKQWRRRGIGGALVTVATDSMREAGATQAYLTADRDFEFWEKLG